MYVIVVGGGEVGYYLTKALLEEGHEVLVIEKDARRCQRIEEAMGSICINGDGCEAAILAEIGTARADMFIAVTDGDEDNLVACQLAKHKFNVSRTIARINNPKNEAIFKKLGIDVTVSSADLILEQIESQVPSHPLTHLLASGTDFEVVEVKILPSSPAVGKKLQELSLPPGSILSLLIRKGQRPSIPTPDTVLKSEDQLIVVTKPESEVLLRNVLAGAPKAQ